MDKNEMPKELLNNSKDMMKENKEGEHATHERERQKNEKAHKGHELSKTRIQMEMTEDRTEGRATCYSKSPSEVPLVCPSSDVDNEKKDHHTVKFKNNSAISAKEIALILEGDKLLRDTEDQSHEEKFNNASAISAKEREQPVEDDKLCDTEDLKKSLSLVNLLVCYSDDSGEEGDNRSESASSSQYERPMVYCENIKDKSVRRRVLKWANKKAKDYYSKKIEKTLKREQEEGNELYAPWYSTNAMMRSQREQEKRKALLKAEGRRQRLEKFLLNWEAKQAQKRALRMEEEEGFNREVDDLWFVNDLM
ncbi:uncharacterized protein LOC134447013 [Engraulis encrasicolus]|uniref:uncharacterized protein LOC134447013 n=1 Tax=Engraulis encrasicolus TaxID=184585 RepID=UPI002FD46F57